MKNLVLAIFLSILSGCFINSGLSPAELQRLCNNEADVCLDTGLSGGVSQWEWIQVNLDCEAEYKACIHETVPIYPTCEEISIACEDDVYNNCFCSDAFCLNCYARLASCRRGYEDCQ